MNRTFGAAALILAIWPAWAADTGRSTVLAPAASVAAVGYSWSGAYGGLNTGYLSTTIGGLGNRPRGFAGGAQAGYNWQVGQVVFGGEADIQASGAEDTFAPYKFSNPWFGTVRGRLGYAFSHVLFYATAGLSLGSGRLQIAGLSETHAQFGWAGGGGIEIGLTPSWSAKAEYLFVGLADKTYVLSGIRSDAEAHLIRFGVNYRF